jgi:predicted acylesterase/phospholipase RssA
MEAKRALVISGGGSKGAFAVGVLLALKEKNPALSFAHYIGTSTGALIAPLALLEEYKLLEQLYTTVTTGEIIHKFNIVERLFQHSLFDGTPLWELIEKHYTDSRCEQLLQSNRHVYLTTTCLQTERLTVFTNNPHPQTPSTYDLVRLQEPDQLRRAVLASASQPVFMAPVKINARVPGARHPHHQYVDGGVLQYAGIEMAIDQGAEEILTILHSTSQESIAEEEFTGLLPILRQTIDIFTTDVGKNDLLIPSIYNEALHYIAAVKTNMIRSGIPPSVVETYFTLEEGTNPFEGKKPLALHLIRPGQPLGGGPGGLNFEPKEMKGMMENGKQAAIDFLRDHAL